MVGAGRVNAVLIGDDLPELGANLVTALATLDRNELTHICCLCVSTGGGGGAGGESWVDVQDEARGHE